VALDVYVPAGAAPDAGWPVVLAIHGGGWRRFSKDDYGPKVAPGLVGQGFAVVAPNYRLSAPGAPSWPDCLNDLRNAIRWIRRVGAEGFDLNPRRIAAMGESAGGHLAAMLGTWPTSDTRIQAVVDFYGPADLVSMPWESPAADLAVKQLLGVNGSASSRVRAQASPVAHASRGDATFLIVHGTADWLVPLSQSQGLARALRAKGVSCRLITIPGANHGFGWTAAGRNLLPEVTSFLRKALA
jgi:acetyl esterase/lipase